MLHLLYVTKTGPQGSLGTWKMRGLSSWSVSFQSTSQIFSFYFPKPSMAPQCLQNKVLDPRTNPNFSLLSNPLQAPLSSSQTSHKLFCLWFFACTFPSTCKAVALHNSKRPAFIRGNVTSIYWTWAVHSLHSYTWPPAHLDHIYRHTHFLLSKAGFLYLQMIWLIAANIQNI